MNKELILKRQFVCPCCGKVHSIDDAHINAILVKQESEMTFNGSFYKDKISSSYVRVRFCPKCKNVPLRNKILRHVSYFLFGPLVLILLQALFCWELPKIPTIGGYFLADVLLFMFYVPAVKIYRELIAPSVYKNTVKRADEGNAII